MLRLVLRNNRVYRLRGSIRDPLNRIFLRQGILRLRGSRFGGAAVAFFYLRRSQEFSNAAQSRLDDILRALLSQLIDQDPDLTDKITSKSGNNSLRLEDPGVMQDIVHQAVERRTMLYLVLDGLDECWNEEEEESVITWFLRLSQSVPGLRIMFAGQRDNVTDRLLSSQPSVSLDKSSEHCQDIENYCRVQAAAIRIKFKAEQSMERKIVELVSKGADGMFLFARIVLQHLIRQKTRAALYRALEPGVFPKTLEEAYRKVDERVFEDDEDEERGATASRILGYVIACKRTLFWREIQAFFCIDASNGEANYDERLADSYKKLCSSFLDSNSDTQKFDGPEDEVILVHETAREFLIRRNRVNLHQQNYQLAVFCFQYLTSPPFTLGVTEDDILSHAKQGYYALQDYTVQYWFDHVLECVTFLDPMSHWDKCQDILQLALAFLKSYGHRDKMQEVLQAETYTQLAEAIKENVPIHGQERNSYFCIDIRTESLRQKIAKMDFGALTAEEQHIFVSLFGPRRSYKCSKPWCGFFKGGLESEASRENHIIEHDFPYRCAYQGCFGFDFGFSTEDSLQNHNVKVHALEDLADSFPKLHMSSASDANADDSSLHAAYRRGDIERVKELLESDEGKKQLNIEQFNRKFNGTGHRPDFAAYPLEIAAFGGHKEVCDLLIANGASVDGHGFPLYCAASRGHLEICELLISRGANVNPVKKKIVDLLLHQESIKPNIKSFGSKRTAAQQAALHGNLATLRVMQASGKVDMSGVLQATCREASSYTYLGTLKYLLQNGYAHQANEEFLSDVKRLAIELWYVTAARDKNTRTKRSPFLISIMEYPKWRIRRSAWSDFLASRQEAGRVKNTKLEEAVDRFVKRIEDNRSTAIIDDEPQEDGESRAVSLPMATED
ncbi:hypothetical protein B0T20DRAFT_470418 [Sordaria brevicollis]|uniref:Nephrocystin 3-like N-terminal domain-containing protein n=1 Tax=Sordaria brevicollis TaxID=83679 RepID=A0AAE0PBD5_SORBR|nr:hypothetical protein B0T20DRAFT_470418 [Sordaria brevicollis]